MKSINGLINTLCLFMLLILYNSCSKSNSGTTNPTPVPPVVPKPDPTFSITKIDTGLYKGTSTVYYEVVYGSIVQDATNNTVIGGNYSIYNMEKDSTAVLKVTLNGKTIPFSFKVPVYSLVNTYICGSKDGINVYKGILQVAIINNSDTTWVSEPDRGIRYRFLPTGKVISSGGPIVGESNSTWGLMNDDSKISIAGGAWHDFHFHEDGFSSSWTEVSRTTRVLYTRVR